MIIDIAYIDDDKDQYNDNLIQSIVIAIADKSEFYYNFEFFSNNLCQETDAIYQCRE